MSVSERDQTFEIVKMNVDNSCDFVCEACSRYFGCTLPEKVVVAPVLSTVNSQTSVVEPL